MNKMDIVERLRQRILILDGAMGTKIQSQGLTPDSYHQGRFVQWPVSLVGNNDVLCLTAPTVISDIHRQYVEAGADIITTNTFSANRISQHEYGCEDYAREMAFEGARIARQVADNFNASNVSRHIFVAGSMGPTSRSLSLASDMNNPGYRGTSFDEMAAAYHEQAEALVAGGADVLLIETCFDALNTKAALYAVQQLNEETGSAIPVMVSATINDRSGRTLTGQTLEAFYISISHYPHLLSFGLNCSFGVTDLRPFVEQLSSLNRRQLKELEEKEKTRAQKTLEAIVMLLPILCGAVALVEYLVIPNKSRNWKPWSYVWVLGIAIAAYIIFLLYATIKSRGGEKQFYEKLEAYEPTWAQEVQNSTHQGFRQRFVAFLEKTEQGFRAGIGLRNVPPVHPAYYLRGTENAIIVRSAFHPYPLVIQGPGEGAREAASSVLNDILR